MLGAIAAIRRSVWQTHRTRPCPLQVMDAPIRFLVDDEPEVLASLAVARERRFGAAYPIVNDPCSTSALGRRERARDRGVEVALGVADQGYLR